MKKAIISILLSTALFTLCSCGKADTVQTSNESIETAEAQEPEEPEPEVEDIAEEEPEQETEEAANVEDNDNVEPEAEEEPDRQEAIEIETLDKTMYASSAVNVRGGDSTSFDVVGQLSFNQSVHVIGRSVETGWYKLEMDGNDSAFVSDKYLSDNMIEVAAEKPKQESTPQQQPQQQQQQPTDGDNEVGNGLTPEAQAWAESHGITTMTWDGTISEPHEITDHTPTGLQAE